MARISLSEHISATFINRLTGLSSTTSSADSVRNALSGGSSQVSISGGLRLGAQAFAKAVTGLNSLSSFVNLSRAKLEDLGEITDKLIDLAEQSASARTGNQKRKQLDREFKALANDFKSIVEDTKIGDNQLLSVDGLTQLFTVVGLDQESSESVAKLFAQFILPEDDNVLASEEIKGGRPVVIPSGSFSGPGATNQYLLTQETDYGVQFGVVTQDGVVFSATDDELNQNSGYNSLFVQNADGTLTTFEAGALTGSITFQTASSNSF